MSAPFEPDPGEELDPIDFLVIELPGGHASATGTHQRRLIDRTKIVY